MGEPRSGWRPPAHRRCQKCDVVYPAGRFKRVNDYSKTRSVRGGWGLRCPACGFTGPTWAFVPADPP
jgi:hypothetical protein